MVIRLFHGEMLKHLLWWEKIFWDYTFLLFPYPIYWLCKSTLLDILSVNLEKCPFKPFYHQNDLLVSLWIRIWTLWADSQIKLSFCCVLNMYVCKKPSLSVPKLVEKFQAAFIFINYDKVLICNGKQNLKNVSFYTQWRKKTLLPPSINNYYFFFLFSASTSTWRWHCHIWSHTQVCSLWAWRKILHQSWVCYWSLQSITKVCGQFTPLV